MFRQLFITRLRAEISTTDNSFANRNLAPTERYGLKIAFDMLFKKSKFGK